MSALAIADAVPSATPAESDALQASTSALVSVVTDRDAFDALETEWNELFDRAGTSAHVFQTHAWLWHWTRHFLKPACNQLAIVTARRGGRLVLVWPMVLTRGPIRRLDWMGEPVSQYGDVLADPGADTPRLLREAWKLLIRHTRPDVVSLRKTRADATVAPLLAELGAEPVCHDTAPFAGLAGAMSFEAYAEHRWSAKTRKNRRRQMRRLEEQGPVTVDRYSSGPEAARLASRAIDVKQAWLAERGLVSPALTDPAYRAFFEAAAAGREHPMGCRISTLTVNGEPAALEIALRCRERMAIHVIAYDAAYEKGGAGAALMEAGIRDAFAEGVTCFDLLGPGGGYKDEWADGCIGLVDWAAAPSIKGRIYARAWLGFLRPRLKAAANTMPLRLRKLLAASIG